MPSNQPPESNDDETGTTPKPALPEVPHWDETHHTLYFGGKVVKRFRRPASSQQLILAAFQEDGWPYRIDDPLVPESGATKRHAKRRLRSAVQNMNRAQHGPVLIHFHLDGTGQGVRWTRDIE